MAMRGSRALAWDIHFWLGNETSQDEAGIAALKSIELDEAIGGSAVHHRECQEHESGIEYLCGGVASAFNHVDSIQNIKRLLHIKGSRTVRVNEVPCNASSLNCGDVFILDLGVDLFLYNGVTSNVLEKAKAADVMHQIKSNERGGKANLHFIDDEPNNDTFWQAIGGQIDVKDTGNNDKIAEDDFNKTLKLMNISDASGNLEITEVPIVDGKLMRSFLSSNNVSIVDTSSKVYVWVGKGVSLHERSNAIPLTVSYLRKSGRPLYTPVTRITENAETTVFKSLFYHWNPPRVMTFGGTISTSKLQGVAQEAVDVEELHCMQDFDCTEDIIDNGEGDVKIWRIENMSMVAIDPAMYGQFFSGDSYICLYTYQHSRRNNHILYFWQGRDSSMDEKATSAWLVKEFDDSLHGAATQIRVVQGKEPNHFRRIFRGKMVIHFGGKGTGFKNNNVVHEEDESSEEISMYQVKGTSAFHTCASQVEPKYCNLNSGDCFVIGAPEYVYIWMGKGASSEEKEVALSISALFQGHKQVVTVEEGNESFDFKGILGGEMEYSHWKQGVLLPKPPRLFECSTVTGRFKVEEICNFAQDDLNSGNIYLLDTYSSVYLWIGRTANESERKMSLELAQKYIASAPDGRDKEQPIVTIRCGHEPLIFTANFLAWDPNMLDEQIFLDPYEARLARMREEKAKNQPSELQETSTSAQVSSSVPVSVAEPAKAASQSTYSYDELVAGVKGIDITSKESYLSDKDFIHVFKMGKDEFYQLPKWRQQTIKKQTQLF